MEMVEFPAPLGELPEFLFGHPEPVTLPKTIEAKNISLRGGICPPWNSKLLRIIRSLGFTGSRERINFAAGFIHGINRIISIGGVKKSGLRIDVIGKENGQERHLVFNMVDRFRPLTAIPCAVGALMLLEGKIKQLPPIKSAI